MAKGLIGQMKKLLDDVDGLHDKIDDLAVIYTRKKMISLSKRYHRHIVEYHSGMGTSCVFVVSSDGKSEHQLRGDYSEIRFQEPLTWMDKLDSVGDCIGRGNSSLPFSVSMKFKNGKELKDGSSN